MPVVPDSEFSAPAARPGVRAAWAGRRLGGVTPAGARAAADARRPPDALTTFAVLWALAGLAHVLAYPDTLAQPSMAAVAGAGLWVLAAPASLLALFALAGAEAGQVLAVGPANVSNHWVLVAAVSLALLAHAGAEAAGGRAGRRAGQRSGRVDRARLFAAFAPTARGLMLVLYFYAVLHKLNADYLDPAWSCAADHYSSIRRTLPLLPDGPLVRQAAIWGSLLVETAIPLLILARRTRVAGVALGLAFHTLLALNPDHTFFDFSSAVAALYFLWLPADVRVRRLGPRARRARSVACGVAGAALAAAVVRRVAPAGGSLAYRALLEGARFTWVALGAAALAVFARAARRRDLAAEVRGADGLRPAAAWAWAFPALLVAHGATPYVGLKTEASFAMFSNLRTEGERWNHLLVPPVKRWGYQDDLVTVLASSDRRLARSARTGERWPYFQFRTLTARAPGASVTYARGGHVVRVPRVADVPELAHPPSAVARWFLRFRSVPPAGARTSCRH